ncbi:MAG: hypothetical protein Q9198_007563 [Flavoplaca austrocitrina]
MGGATAEGVVNLVIDGGLKKAKATTNLATISIDRISVSIVGIERSGARQHMFRCLTTDLIDEAHPPPVDMAPPDQPISDRLWEVKPSTTLLPFRLDLPIMLGPPPYRSRKNSITYLVSVLVEAKMGGKRSYVRESGEVTVLTVHDRRSCVTLIYVPLMRIVAEKALLNLPNPLVVTEEVQTSHRGGLDSVELTAGVHRQTWISGYPLFVDVRIDNRGSRFVKKVELQLERMTFIYAHAAPSEEQGLGDTLRLPDRCEKEVILKVSNHAWQVQPQSSDLKTCSLSVPPGLVSVDADISYNYRPGQAFLAARRQSFDQAARKTISQEEITSITNALDDNEPEKFSTQQARRRASTTHISTNPKLENPRLKYRNSRFLEGTNSFRNPTLSPPKHPPPVRPPMVSTQPLQHQGPEIPQRRTHRASLEEYSSRYPGSLDQQQRSQHRRTRTLEDRQYRGPRLQRSTSGLKFSSSEDEEVGGGVVGDTRVDEARARLKKKMGSESQRPLRMDF